MYSSTKYGENTLVWSMHCLKSDIRGRRVQYQYDTTGSAICFAPVSSLHERLMNGSGTFVGDLTPNSVSSNRATLKLDFANASTSQARES